MKIGIVYIVATPIGNLEDFSFRALKILKNVDLILAEDTRKTKILLDRYKIKKPLISYHQHTKSQKIEEIIIKIKSGQKTAFVTDAGTPGISDPGIGLVSRLLQEKEISIIPVPGSCAATTLLSISGFPSDKFLFFGFLPKKKGRRTFFNNLKNLFISTIVFYESPYRIKKTLLEIQNFLGDNEIVVGRELTKKFETIYRGKISQVLPQIKPKGEFTIAMKLKK